MSRDIERSFLAQRDFDETAFYFADFDVLRAERFLQAAESVLRQVSEMPGIGSIVSPPNPRLPGLRRVPIREFKQYSVYYIHDDPMIEVLRVLHSSRNVRAIREGEG